MRIPLLFLFQNQKEDENENNKEFGYIIRSLHVTVLVQRLCTEGTGPGNGSPGDSGGKACQRRTERVFFYFQAFSYVGTVFPGGGPINVLRYMQEIIIGGEK